MTTMLLVKTALWTNIKQAHTVITARDFQTTLLRLEKEQTARFPTQMCIIKHSAYVEPIVFKVDC